MKRLICVLLIFCMLFSLAACRESGMPRPDFPLEEEIVTTTVEKLELPGVISEKETYSSTDGHICYTLRTEDQLFCAAISSAMTDKKRYLSIIFRGTPISEKPVFAWEDWKQQFVLVTLLSGGFADEEELYRAFSQQEMPEPKEPKAKPDQAALAYIRYTEIYQWEAELPTGYCRVSYSLNPTKMTCAFASVVIEEWSCMLTVTVYQSKKMYKKQMKELSNKKSADN